MKRRGPSISVTTRLEVVPISTGNITPINRRMPNCTTVVQTASALFEPEIRLNLPKNDTFRPFIRLKNLPKSFGIVQLNTETHVITKADITNYPVIMKWFLALLVQITSVITKLRLKVKSKF